MRILSLFDGISCGRVALERAGVPVTEYMASEIDKYAIQISQKNYPDVVHLGDVKFVRMLAESNALGKVDLLIGGSPCQGFSFAGEQLAFDDPRSVLFFDYLQILTVLRVQNPHVKFMLENVKMKKKHLGVITALLGVEPVLINSALVSAQNRQRYYWCNWQVGQPEDRGLLLRDIIESGQIDREKSFCIDAHYYKGGSLENYKQKRRRQNNLSPTKVGNIHPSGRGMNGFVYDLDGKAPTLTTNKGEGSKVAFRQSEKRLTVSEVVMKQRGRGKNKGFEKEPEKCPTITSNHWEQNNLISTDNRITYRKLSPVECERLQTLPDNYTQGVSNTQRYKQLGNGWTVEVISHIFGNMPR